MNKRTRTPRRTTQSVLLSATAAADLLGIGRTRFWQLRKKFDNPKRVPWSPETRPLFRREDVLKFFVPQDEQEAVPDAATIAAPKPTNPAPRPVLAIDAGFKVAKGFEHITVEEWHAVERETQRMKQSVHLPDLE